MEKKLSFYAAIGVGVASILTYAYTTFATVDFVKAYVDIRHQVVIEKLEEINNNVNRLIWDKDEISPKPRQK